MSSNSDSSKPASVHVQLEHHSEADSETQEHIGKERYGAGDTYLVRDVLPSDELEGTLERLCSEVQWCTMSHRGGEVPRLVAVQGTVDPDGTIPVYRHPADESPPLNAFTPTVSLIRQRVAQYLPEGHPLLNHVLIQLYRSGEDYISEHADKTVDIVRGSCIVNVSLGAQRTMTLRTKKNYMSEHTQQHEHEREHEHLISSRGSATPTPTSTAVERTTQRIPLPHNSALILGLETNRIWLHGIRADRRSPFLLSGSETAFERQRVSLTFRSIGTFLSPVPGPSPIQTATSDQEHNKAETQTETRGSEGGDGKWLIWGQGATSKTREPARPVITDAEASAALLYGFGQENHLSDFDWDNAYGRGFDVLNFTA